MSGYFINIFRERRPEPILRAHRIKVRIDAKDLITEYRVGLPGCNIAIDIHDTRSVDSLEVIMLSIDAAASWSA
jgi:hypothetical protein